jgi:hypothetical protein
MKRVMSVLMCMCLIGVVMADLGITNGDFQTNAPAGNVANVDSWFDPIDANPGNWWETTWYGPTVSPNGTSVMGLSYMWKTTNWAYQSIGTNSSALASLALSFDVGSFTDAGSNRDLGVTVSIYKTDGTFVGADGTDIVGAAGVTLVDSVSVMNNVASGAYITQNVTLDLSNAGSGELFLRFVNYAGTVGEPWTAIDNVSIVPEPATMLLLGLGGLLLKRRS